MESHRQQSILLTGATGAVGGALLPKLLDQGHSVKALVRNPEQARLAGGIEIVEGDVLSGSGLDEALAETDVAYYLIHSMGRSPGDFELNDRIGARNFAQAAERAGVRRIVYLGGLPPSGGGSAHLSSRAEVAEILAAAVPEPVHARAAMVIGADSASFTMLSQLVHRLPLMVGPKWIETRTQPIASDDVTSSLATLASFQSPPEDVELGGAEIVSYRQMMDRFARIEGRREPLIIPVPVLSPRLSSYWVRFVTSVEPALARPLIDGLKEEMIVRTPPPAGINDNPMNFQQAVERAMQESNTAAK
jgi:uncharacterized protein YbjT (DUF2867 family)